MKNHALVFFSVLFLLGATAAAQPLPKGAAGKKIALDIKGMDVADVLKMIAAEAGLNLVIDKGVSGRVNLLLKDVRPEEALDAVLAAHRLVREERGSISLIMTAKDYEEAYGVLPPDYREFERVILTHVRARQAAALLEQLKSTRGRILVDETANAVILVDTAEKNKQLCCLLREMDVALFTESLPLRYAPAAAVAPLLAEALGRPLAGVVVDERSNQLIVRATREDLARLRRLLEELDVRGREVMIDARIVQVNLDDKLSLGVDWDALLCNNVRWEGRFDQLVSSGGSVWTLGTLAPEDPGDWRAVVEALRTVGEVRILSSPRLTVTHNESAKILVGSKQVYVTSSAVVSPSATQTTEAVNFVDVGVKLYVTPAVSPDGFICLKVRPEVSSVVENYRTAAGNTIPVVETSEAETTVLLKDGAAMVIAGLMKEEKVRTVNKVPLLGDIPFLGALFRSRSERDRKTELAIFLTCRIVEWDAGAGPDETVEKEKGADYNTS